MSSNKELGSITLGSAHEKFDVRENQRVNSLVRDYHGVISDITEEISPLSIG